jgi:hypothetical protein
LFFAVACQPIRPRHPRGSGPVTLTVLPAESDSFPRTARALTEQLRRVDIDGVDKKQVSKVSLEVVQLSIECVEPSARCYAEVGKSLAANRLLFAQIAKGGHKNVQVSVTLFDVDAREPRTTKKVFANEQEATAGVKDLVVEATR